MQDTTEEEVRIIPDWRIGDTLTYRVWKKETFSFKTAQSPPFERSYLVELRLLENNIVEAYYPNSLLSTVKLLNMANPYFAKINHARQNTLYYEIDEDYRFVAIKNLDKLVEDFKKIKEELKQIISEEEYEDIAVELDVFENSPNYVNKHFKKDIDTIHEFYGSIVYDGYYFDLDEKKSLAKSLKKKLLKLVNLNLGKIDIFQTDFIDEDHYQIEVLRGTDTVSTKTRQDFQQIKEKFINQEFDITKQDDITLHHQKFIYNQHDFILRAYHYHFKIDTPKMKKLMQSKIELYPARS